MNKQNSTVVVLLLALIFSSLTFADKSPTLGTVYGHSLYTDIKTYLNGDLIHGVNVDGYTAVKVKVFQGRGYDVKYDDKLRRVDIITNPNASGKIADLPPQENLAVGTVIGDIIASDILVYIDYRRIDAYNCDGNMLLMVEALSDCGFQTAYSNESRTMTIKTDKNYHNVRKGKKTDSKQSNLMFEYTGLAWSDELENALAEVDFSDFNFDIKNPKEIEHIDSLFVLANKANYFPENFVPKDLVAPTSRYAGGGDRNKLRKHAADALDSLVAAAAEAGQDIKNVSAYRSIAYQKDLFNYYANKDGIEAANRYSSKPGYSEHHTGLCADVSSPNMGFNLYKKYGKESEGIWLANNAHLYGFIIRYPEGKEKLTGYTYEPWHIRYLGVPLATYLYQSKLTYEEFLALQVGKLPREIVIE